MSGSKPWVKPKLTRHDPNDPAWRDLLAQVGMGIGADGRYWIMPPPRCTHAPQERNGSSWQLTCDGCRRPDGDR